MEKYGGNLPPAPRRKLRRAAPAPKASAKPKAGSPLRPLATPQALAKAKLPKQINLGEEAAKRKKLGSKQAGGLPVLHDLEGVGRVLVHGTGAIASDVYHHPGEAGKKSVSSLQDIAHGVANAALALPVYAAEYPISKAFGKKGPESPGHFIKREVKGAVKAAEYKYGPSFRGEKGARKRLSNIVRKEGPVPTALDMSVLGGPASAGLGKAAGLGRIARPALRVNPLAEAATKQTARSSVSGAALQGAQNTVRRVAQKNAELRSVERHRVRVLKKVGVKPRHIEKRAPSILNTEPKPLTARRANLKPGEVAPLSEKIANRQLRRRTADYDYRATAHGEYRASKAQRELRKPFRKLTPEQEHAAVTAANMGIKDSASARNMIPLKIKEIEQSRAAALAKKTKDVKAEKRGVKANDPGELPIFQQYLAHPEIFDRPGVQAAADAVRVRRVGPREGLGPEQAASARSKHVGQTLGVKTAAELHAEAKVAHAERLAAADANVAAKRAEVVKQQKAVIQGRLLTREAAIGKGRIRLSDPATLKSISRHEGKVARRTPLARVAGHGEGLVRHAHGLDVAKQELRAARQARAEIAREAPKRVGESPTQYEARVVARTNELGGVAPEYTPSKFEQRGLRSDARRSKPKNPTGRQKSGKLVRLGRENKTLDTVEQTQTANLKRGAQLEQHSKLLEEFGKFFRTPEEATKFAEGLGLRTEQSTGMFNRKHAPDVAIHTPEVPVSRSTGATPRKGNKAEAGDYVHTDGVFLLPHAVEDELKQLKITADKPPNVLRKLAHYPQTALLALSPSWWQFQRAADVIALSVGGALPRLPSLIKQYKGLDAESREIVDVLAGGGVSSELLTPFSVQKVGRIQRILDEAPTFRDALASRKPATMLLRAGHDLPTALLRSDRAITGHARQLQLLHNLNRVAAKMDPNVSAISRAFGPIGHAFKTGDGELVQKLLKDPAYQAKLEDAVHRLTEVHGDWHTYTARERDLKHYAAFYGFLRYATRMAFLTLPINHPYIGLLIAELGKMGADDSRKIIGPDLPYGLGALYNDDGTIAADLTRANPILGPLMSVTKPEQVLSLATPLAGVAMNYLLGQPVALNDSSEGRVTQYTVEGDPNNHAVGGLFGKDRARIGAAQLLGLLGPGREWEKFDARQQSSDSLPWDRRYLESESGKKQLRINERNAAAEGGTGGLIHDLFPLVAPGSKKNMKLVGQSVAKAKQQAAQDAELRAAKREGVLHTDLGHARREIDMAREKIAAAKDEARAQIDDARRQIKLARLRSGLKP